MKVSTGFAASALLGLPALTVAGAVPEYLRKLLKKQIPAEPTDVITITSPNGFDIRYKEPGKAGVCETTPGVNSYSGYVDLNNETHMFFWFFEARNDPNNAPLTLWLNGGPGSDSLIGLFAENGPCYITSDGTNALNPYSWNEVTNLLYLSQPIGVGFSYADEVVGIINETTALPQSSANPNGRYPNVNPYAVDTTQLAAVGTWEVLQALIQELPTLDATVSSRSFNLWTESYGGHYGPVFFDYFSEQNQLIVDGNVSGVALEMHTLGVGDGLISLLIQAQYWPEYAFKNNYGIQAVNETIYNFMMTAYSIPGACSESDLSTPYGLSTCASAVYLCQQMLMFPYFSFNNLSSYDVRANAYSNFDIPPSYWVDYINTADVQNALGVDLNYTMSSEQVWEGFTYTGDWAYVSILENLETLLDAGVRVNLYYGDADYICNWMGGEAVSLQVNYTHSAEFQAAGYAPFVVDGTEYGAVRQYGNFSFVRIYDAGHEVPYYQPVAALEMLRRVLADLVISDGSEKVTPTYSTNGTASATHTEPYTIYTGRPDGGE
ncbi:serine carboxypeptidase [Xylariales sp. PMI_506]|nr:serine carboxypeptidase [Xylariales sp. PMI_506]